jgi:hypothetical protein
VSDPLSIPDDKRAGSGRISFFDTPDRSWLVWAILAVIVILNVWYDYHHPLWILLDFVFLTVWAVRSAFPERNE